MSYGFNDDKSKVEIFKMIEIVPTSSTEKVKDFVPRVWSAVNSIGMGRIVDIELKNGSGNNANAISFSALNMRIYESGNLNDRVGLTAFTTNFYNDGSFGSLNFINFELFASSNIAPTKAWRRITIKPDGSLEFSNAYGPDDEIGYIKFKIYYVEA